MALPEELKAEIEEHIKRRVDVVRGEVRQVKHAHDALAAMVTELAATVAGGAKGQMELAKTVRDLSKLVSELAQRPN